MAFRGRRGGIAAFLKAVTAVHGSPLKLVPFYYIFLPSTSFVRVVKMLDAKLACRLVFASCILLSAFADPLQCGGICFETESDTDVLVCFDTDFLEQCARLW